MHRFVLMASSFKIHLKSTVREIYVTAVYQVLGEMPRSWLFWMFIKEIEK